MIEELEIGNDNLKSQLDKAKITQGNFTHGSRYADTILRWDNLLQGWVKL